MTAAEAVASRRSAVAFSRLRRRVAEIDVWWWPLIAMLVIWTAYFTHESIEIHNGLGTSSYDLGLYDQGVWLLSRFHSPFVTLMGRNLFGDHTSFVMVLFVPIYWIAPSVGSLLLVQSAVIAAGAVPIFLYARQRLESGWIALIFGGAYLLHPAVGWTNLENFHPDSFLGFFVGMAIWAALSRRWRTYAVFVVLSLLVKEDVSLVIVPLGVWVALRRDRRIGLITILGSLGFMLVAMFAIMRALIGVPTRNTWRIPFGGVSGLVTTAINRPGELFEYLRTENRPWYLWQMIFPAAWASVRRPAIAAISVVVLAANVVSVYWYQHQVEFHYSLIAVPALTLGAVYGVAALGDRRPHDHDIGDRGDVGLGVDPLGSASVVSPSAHVLAAVTPERRRRSARSSTTSPPTQHSRCTIAWRPTCLIAPSSTSSPTRSGSSSTDRTRAKRALVSRSVPRRWSTLPFRRNVPLTRSGIGMRSPPPSSSSRGTTTGSSTAAPVPCRRPHRADQCPPSKGAITRARTLLRRVRRSSWSASVIARQPDVDAQPAQWLRLPLPRTVVDPGEGDEV